MDNSDTYIINLKKDYGRYLSSQNIIKVFGGSFIEANDCNKLNDKGYVTEWKDSNIYTQSAKQTKRKILEEFYKKSDKKYITIFEDDIYLHNDLIRDKKNNILDQLNSFVLKKSPKLLYFGISREFTSTNICTSQIEFISFAEKFGKTIKLCSGAYGFMLRKDMIPYVLMRIDNPIFGTNPFDIYCLSYIAFVYPCESYVINPQLVVPDITHSNIRKNFDQSVLWKALKTSMNLYHIPIIGIMYVNVINEKSFNYFNKMISCIAPTIKILYYGNTYENKEIFYSLEDAKKEIIFTSAQILCNIYTSTDIIIKHYSGKKILDHIIYHKNNKKITILNESNIKLFSVEYLGSETSEETIIDDL